MSPTPDRTLANPEQLIADLQRQLAECKAERDAGLQRETATTEVLQVVNSSPGDLVPVFDAILEKALRLCGAAYGHVFRVEGDLSHAVAARGDPEFVEWLLKQGPVRPTPGGILHRMMQGERVVQIPDSTDTDVYRSGSITREIIDRSGVRTTLGVALRNDRAMLGAIFVNRREMHPFSDKEIALLETFAAQAVIAMENARLITETREALEQQTATAEVLQVINSSPGDLSPVFDAMVERAKRLCGAANAALFTPFDGELFHLVAVAGEPQLLEQAQSFGPIPSTNAMQGRLAKGEDLVHIADVRETDLYRESPILRERVGLLGLRTWLGVALRKEDVLLGTIAVSRKEVRPFSEREIALLQNFAAQAVIAMENARLLTETREALEQQTATAEVLQVINSSPGDLTPVFDAILEKAIHLCGAAFGTLWTYDGEVFRPVALRRVPAAFAELLSRAPYRPEPGSMHERLLQGAAFVQIEDITAESRIGPVRKALVEVSGARTFIGVPLRKDETVVGAITAYRQEVRPFTEKQIALLQSFAAQAVIAMENARLITETREALEQQTATAEVLQVINSSPGDLAPVFETILEKAHILCGAAHGTLTLADGEYFRAVATRGRQKAAEMLRQPHRPTHDFQERLLRGEVVHIADLTDPEFSSDEPIYRTAVDLGGARTLLMVPLRKDGALLGYLTANRKEVRPFSNKQIALLENFAAQAVIAMENARLINETREALEQQTATAEVLGVINSSPGELAPVFEAILEKAHGLCRIDIGTMDLYESGKFRTVAVRGLSGPLAELLREPFEPPPESGFGRLLAGEPAVQITDVSELAPWRPDSPRAQLNAQYGLRTALLVPLRKDADLLGFVVAFRQEVRPFTDKQIALLQNFAAQAVIAIENARLLSELRQRTEEVGALNRDLEARVAAQVDELGRVGRLKRFLAPQLAELIVSQGDEKILESHRREIVVVFCDLRGYTAFTETAEPEEVLDFLREYHGALGPLVSQFEGILDQFSGDGIMVFFNDPVPCPDPAERAVKMAMAMREEAGKLITTWRRDGCELGFGAGIAQGYATLGQIGFSERSGYTAIGTVCNLAARLCAEAKDGQILISSRVARAVEAVARLEDLGNLELRGLRRPVAAFNVVHSTSAVDARPNLTVIARGPGPN